ncbi:MAG: hypothetical protein WBA13_19815 [Microcoleaceae cyanobacterium]
MADLNGTWLGTYWQRSQPTRFEATIIHAGNTLSGNILDHNYLGEARCSGTVTGRQINFTKRYFMSSPDPITYIGTISEDENYIKGTWNIGFIFSGQWEARRSGENLSIQATTRQVIEVSN